MENDFAFDLGEIVTVGNQRGTVTGQATFASEPDQFQVLVIDASGLPAKVWFSDELVSRLGH